MKKVLLFAAFAAFAMTSVNAQDSGFAKSDIYMTGTVGFNSSTTSVTGADDADTSDMNLSPTIGYMLTDNIALEAGLSYGTSESFNEDFGADSETTTTSFGIGAR
ncbi:MAG: opacity protein-like surface antigen, partial [Flavobacteriales bacterium]